jgi:sterol desaturase/sphingolipid hydroxylase (fatty acid hydroxylase superfamily)
MDIIIKYIMISFNSIKNFITVNTTLVLVSAIDYLFSSNYLATSFPVTLARNCLFLNLLDYLTKDKPYINEKERKIILQKHNNEFMLYLCSSTIVETITNLFLIKQFTNDDINNMDLVYFIPLSFAFEVIFDFFHYWAHRILHQNKTLYRLIHKDHHRFNYPIPIITFFQHPLDLLITNSTPSFISFFIINKLFGIGISNFLFKLIMTYKTYIEIAGHCGKEINTPSFPQFIWIPRFFDMELYTANHDLHHSSNNCNYSKRFSLWDKVFGTYSR